MTFNDDIEAELAHVQPKTQAMSESWGASAILFGAGSLLWPLVFFLAFFARAGMLAAEESTAPHYGAAWRETIEVVAISGQYVGWVAPSLLALLVGLGFLITPNSDLDSQSVLRPLPYVAALIGGVHARLERALGRRALDAFAHRDERGWPAALGPALLDARIGHARARAGKA